MEMLHSWVPCLHFEFLLWKCFPVKVRDSITVINWSPGTQCRGCLWVTACRECRMSWSGMAGEWWRGGVPVLFWSLGVLTNKGQIPGWDDEVTSLNTRLALWEIGGHAHKRQAGYVKVGEAVSELFLRKWRFPWHSALSELLPQFSCNSHNSVKPLPVTFAYMLAVCSSGSKNGGRCN